jgi:hypothetical protein
MLTVAVAMWTVIVTSMMVTDSTGGVDVCTWQSNVRNNRQCWIVNESDYKDSEIHIDKGKDNGRLGLEMLAYSADCLKCWLTMQTA